MFNLRLRQILMAIRQHRQLSQAQIHQMLGIRKNTICTDIVELAEAKLIRECGTQALERGRPRTVLEIDDTSRHILGISIQAHRIQACRLNLLGQMIGNPYLTRLSSSRQIISAAAAMLSRLRRPETLAAGIATPGLIDMKQHTVMLSVLEPGEYHRDLKPLINAAGSLPIILENDVNAMAAKWWLTSNHASGETILMVFIEDGQIGSALLVDGRPVPGCVIGSLELGHTRLELKTKRCYCGHIGCLERIFSTDFLRETYGQTKPLFELAATAKKKCPQSLEAMIGFLARGISNVVNFIKPHRLVLISPLCESPVCTTSLHKALRSNILAGLVDHMTIESWQEPSPRSAEIAGWLAMASIYSPGWLAQPTIRPSPTKIR